jgi:hypothetical protein
MSTRRIMRLVAGVSVVVLLLGAGQAEAVPVVFDKFTVQRQDPNPPLEMPDSEDVQFADITNAPGALAGFTSGVVVLLEPASALTTEPAEVSLIRNTVVLTELRRFGLSDADSNRVSDVFAVYVNPNCSLCVTFGSDGATTDQFVALATVVEIAMLSRPEADRKLRVLGEDGTLQQVGDYFGVNPNQVQVGSDVVPEPPPFSFSPPAAWSGWPTAGGARCGVKSEAWLAPASTSV